MKNRTNENYQEIDLKTHLLDKSIKYIKNSENQGEQVKDMTKTSRAQTQEDSHPL